MAQTTFAGHPLHPQLISAPLGLLPFSLILDVMHLSTGRQSYADAAYYCMAGGVVGALGAAAAGTADYFAIPPEKREVRTTATVHGLLNVAAVGLYGLNLFLRRGHRRSGGAVGLFLNLAGVAGLFVSGWLGGDLVYHYGMRVKGVSPTAEAPEWKLPGDDRIGEAVLKMEEAVAPANP